ncbi:hypothetical protein E2C01_018184 [Portunus trituberculatus]|uniref:Uncharacterized protein n=1 Tax=Portunus trituberculatus TaxID=210409 RepID=A0A5B7DW42_PORTR|nr:hypothetical protein [Portunus trituberculatus]
MKALYRILEVIEKLDRDDFIKLDVRSTREQGRKLKIKTDQEAGQHKPSVALFLYLTTRLAGVKGTD